MRDREYRAVGEVRANALLDERVRLHVDGRCRLVEDEHSRMTQQRARETQQLPLTGRQVLTGLAQLKVESARRCWLVWLVLLQHSCLYFMSIPLCLFRFY